MTTFALVHGAWHGAWCFERLVAELQRRDHHIGQTGEHKAEAHAAQGRRLDAGPPQPALGG